FKKNKKPLRPNTANKGILELKELTNPGIKPFANWSAKKIQKQVKRNAKFEQRSGLGDFYQMVKFGCAPYELRPRWNNYKGVSLYKDGKRSSGLNTRKERTALFANEAQLLGKLHRKKAKNKKEYEKELKKATKTEWKKAARRVAELVKKDWQDLAVIAKEPQDILG
ncbi:MAG: hypothetical protein HQL52_12570, partial [Magnetococcales bacterium]|nr:hypothetical protein [Magnetococcales bacterium]